MEAQPTDTEDTRTQVTWDEINRRLHQVLDPLMPFDGVPLLVYGVPKNGMILTAYLPANCRAVPVPEKADVILDDLIDSGRTANEWQNKFPDKPFKVLWDKRQERTGWLVFPWEDEHRDREEVVVRQLEMIGEDPTREGLLQTPGRVVKAWDKMFSGYGSNPLDFTKAVFTESHTDEMVILKNIEFYSTCEHHILPFFGRAHVAYIPKGGRVIGVSKIARIVDCFSRRLQIQERLTSQIARFLSDALKPVGVGVVLEAQHLCMMARGVEKQNSIMTTSAMYGAMRDKPEAREEFLNRI